MAKLLRIGTIFPPHPNTFGVTNPGQYPSPVAPGFKQATAQIRVRRRPGHNPYTPPFIDCFGYSAPSTAQDAFARVAKAWDTGAGYPWANTAYPQVTIDQSDWNNMAASFQWYKGGGRYQTRTGYQWFQGYQLAAFSANLRNPNAGNIARNADALAFVAAPDGTYAPIEITAGFFEYTQQIQFPGFDYELTFYPTPNLGGFLRNIPPDPPYDFPALTYSVTPPIPNGKRRVRRPWMYNSSSVWWTSQMPVPTPGYLVDMNVFNAFCIPNAHCYWQFFYVNVRGTYGDDVLQFDEIIPTQEPGPPFQLWGPAIRNFI